MIMSIDYKALMQVKAVKDKLTEQEFRTIRGQIFAGDSDGALKGLRKILFKRK